ncbi:MAG: LPP20 family lipoprotein [Chitinispirillales bacterium]|jgi:hypothetical protein|nr:LPP20 family lipoprotein [Chitinispirillales bacterium]
MVLWRVLTILAITTAMFTGCNSKMGGQAKYRDSIPVEIQQIIKDKLENGLYAVGTSRSGDEMAAINKASMQARAEIARQFRAQISAFQKDYQESVGERAGGEYTQVMEIFTAIELRGSRIVKSMVTRDNDGHYIAKVLVAVSAEEMKVLLDERFRAYTSVRASKAYRELENRVEQEKRRNGELESQ